MCLHQFGMGGMGGVFKVGVLVVHKTSRVDIRNTKCETLRNTFYSKSLSKNYIS
jgi:hypothetical protein